jgi:hypothetical protein
LEELANPRDFDARTASVRPEDVKDKVRISADLGRHIDWLRADFELGFAAVYLHSLGRDMDRFLDVFGERVLPAVRGAPASN